MNLDPVILAELMRGGPPLWVSGRTYPVGFVVRSPGNLQTYVRVTAGAGNADPSGGDANWMILSKRIETAIAALADTVAAARTESWMWRDEVKATVNSARDGVNGNVYAVRDQVQATVNAARDAVQYTVNTSANNIYNLTGAVKDIVAQIKDAVLGSGIKSVQRGFVGQIGTGRFDPFYEVAISPVNPSKAELRLLTTFNFSNNQGPRGTIALNPSGTAIRTYALAYSSQAGNTFAEFSYEVTEWK